MQVKSIFQNSVLILGAAAFLTGCKSDHKEHKKEHIVEKAVVKLSPTKGNNAHGTVTFIAAEGGMHIIANVEGLTPGKHGFHIHENGDCSAPDGSSAGAHFNPTKHKHGAPDSQDRHVGDLGNLEANENGVAHYDRVDGVLKFTGETSILNRSVVVHADADDYKTQPTGNSGGRVACGVIEPSLR